MSAGSEVVVVARPKKVVRGKVGEKDQMKRKKYSIIFFGDIPNVASVIFKSSEVCEILYKKATEYWTGQDTIIL